MELIVAALVTIVALFGLIAQFTRRPGQGWSDRMSEIGDVMSEGGERMQKLGCGLTLALTVPILGLVFFGLLGLIVGAMIGLLFGIGLIGQAFTNKPPPD